MYPTLTLYNTLARKLTPFKPLYKGQVHMYVCGPTVYGPTHLGNARSAVIFDVVVRTLHYLGYKVRYVRNITDVGHLTGDADQGEDKVGARARLEQVSPMEIAHRYTNSYLKDIAQLNVLPPNISPLATGHITEQITLVETLLAKGFAYVVNGSVYFNVRKYHAKHPYGILSGKQIADLLTGTRALHGVEEKQDPLDFALWKKASSNHLMRWPSPWGLGFPGWHVECTAMSAKYLGTTFDIHGGGIDLTFPHHECELAQSWAAYGKPPARYWIHHNLVTIKGKKMSKSANNIITVQDCFKGTHTLLTNAYSPMALRLFMLQAHYRSTVNFSNQALQAAEKAYYKLINGFIALEKMTYRATNQEDIDEKLEKQVIDLCAACQRAICEDLHTAKVVSYLFDLLKYINALHLSLIHISEPTRPY